MNEQNGLNVIWILFGVLSISGVIWYVVEKLNHAKKRKRVMISPGHSLPIGTRKRYRN